MERSMSLDDLPPGERRFYRWTPWVGMVIVVLGVAYYFFG
jgi:hypothetical protein